MKAKKDLHSLCNKIVYLLSRMLQVFFNRTAKTADRDYL